MKKGKMKGSAAIILLAFMALILAMETATADPLTGIEGETQSMIIIGCALAVGIAGVGSATGLMLAGSSAVAVTGERPELFGRCLVFQVLPMTQAVYGLLTAILLMMGAGLLGGGSGADRRLAGRRRRARRLARVLQPAHWSRAGGSRVRDVDTPDRPARGRE